MKFRDVNHRNVRGGFVSLQSRNILLFVSATVPSTPYLNMSFRTCAKRLSASIASQSALARQTAYRSYATPAAASNLPADFQNAIEVCLIVMLHSQFIVMVLTSAQREAALPNSDPLADSQTSRLVDASTPFMVPTYVRPPPMFQQGEGCYLYDVENRQYLDFTAGIAVNALGHCDPEMARLIAQQVGMPLLLSSLDLFG